jgi:hypothetical protein
MLGECIFGILIPGNFTWKVLYEKIIENQVVKNRKQLFSLTFLDTFTQNLPISCFRDLSYNDLTGSLPEFLAQLRDLNTL